MTCESRDEALLMLAHGALDGTAAWRIRAHLLVCPRCRARLRRMEGLTASLADALRNPRLGARTLGRSPRSSWASAGLLAVLLATLGGIVASHAVSAPSEPALAAASRAALPVLSCHAPLPVSKKKTDHDDLAKESPKKSNFSTSRCER